MLPQIEPSKPLNVPRIASDSRTQEDNVIRRGDMANGTVDKKSFSSPIAKVPGAGRIVLMLSSIWVGIFFAALDSTIIATLAGPISSSFESSTLLSWLASGFLIANVAIQPLSGKFTDVFGRRIGLIFSNLLFGIGTMLCGFAQRKWVLILGRIITGLGAGGINTISAFITSDLVPMRQRGVYQGIASICYGLGSGLGGVFGGYMNSHWGWRSAFYFQLPFIIASTMLVALTLRLPVTITDEPTSRLKRIDFLGGFTLVAALVLLLSGLSSAGNLIPWIHPLILTSLLLSIILFCLFIYIEDHVAEPIIPVRFLLNRTALSIFLANWLLTMSAFGILYYVPIYFQIRGLSPTQSGIRLIPNSIGAALGSFSAGLVIFWREQYYYFNLIIEVLLIIAYGLIVVFFTSSINAWLPFFVLFLSGFGYGAMLTITFVALVGSVDQSHQAVVTSVSYLARSTGSVIGVTITSAIFQNMLRLELWARFSQMPNAERIIYTIRENVDEIDRLPKPWADGARESHINALRGVWLCILGTGALGAVSSLGMKELSEATKSA